MPLNIYKANDLEWRRDGAHEAVVIAENESQAEAELGEGLWDLQLIGQAAVDQVPGVVIRDQWHS